MKNSASIGTSTSIIVPLTWVFCHLLGRRYTIVLGCVIIIGAALQSVAIALRCLVVQEYCIELAHESTVWIVRIENSKLL